MTTAKRVAPLLDLAADGKLVRPYLRDDKKLTSAIVAARCLVEEGADEVWIRLTHPGQLQATAMLEPIRLVREFLPVPVVAWLPLPTLADARLLVSFGADRVVVEASDADFDVNLAEIRSMGATVGSDRITVKINVRRVATDKSFSWELLDGAGVPTGLDALGAAIQLCSAGANEILVVSVFDGQLAPQATDFVEKLSERTSAQVVCFGLEGSPQDLAGPLLLGADAVLCSRLLESADYSVGHLKRAFEDSGLSVRPARLPYIEESSVS